MVESDERRLFEAKVRRLIEEAQPSAQALAEDPRGVEKRRVEAIRWLLEVRRVQLGEAKRQMDDARPSGSPPLRLDEVGDTAVRPDVRDFFARVATRIWSSPNPAAAMNLFMNGRKSKGARKGDEKKFRAALALAMRVQDGVNSGKPIHAAIREIAQAEQTKRDRAKDEKHGTETAFVRVQKAYYRAMKNPAVRADLAIRGY